MLSILRRLRIAVACALGFTVPASASDLSIQVSGDLLRYGGVLVVYPLPIPADTWEDVGGATPTRVTVESRMAIVQLRYKDGANYLYRFTPVDAEDDAARIPSQALSVIGVNAEGEGPVMVNGYSGAVSSGGRIIRVLPLDEYAGESEAERSAARWGRTQGWATPPPADQRSARILAGLLRDTQRPLPMDCSGTGLYQVCTPQDWTHPEIERRWWRGIAEARLERLEHKALRACFESTLLGGGQCDPAPNSDEPEFVHSR